MLTDVQVCELANCKRYRKIIRTGVKRTLSDIAKEHFGELDADSFVASGEALFGERVVRSELNQVAKAFVERLINKDLSWKRSPSSVQSICEERYHWMRFDEPQLVALRLCFDRLLTNAGFRALLKEKSDLAELDGNERLNRLHQEGSKLLVSCHRFIRWRKAKEAIKRLLEDETVEEEYFMNQKSYIDTRILETARNGMLGPLPMRGVDNE